MGNIERLFEQRKFFCSSMVLDRYISDENVLFVCSNAQCFLKKKSFKNRFLKKLFPPQLYDK